MTNKINDNVYEYVNETTILFFQYCMMQHMFDDNTKSLCCIRESISDTINTLTATDLEDFRKLLSFRPYVEKQPSKDIINLFNNDDIFKESLFNCVNDYHDYLLCFYTGIRMLVVFIQHLPKNELGKTVSSFLNNNNKILYLISLLCPVNIY